MTWQTILIRYMPYFVPAIIMYLNILGRKKVGQGIEGSGADLFLTMISLDIVLLFGNLGDELKAGLSLCFLIIHVFMWQLSLCILFGSQKFPEKLREPVTQILAFFFFAILISEIIEGGL
jgi:hypothetical protein